MVYCGTHMSGKGRVTGSEEWDSTVEHNAGRGPLDV